MDFAGSASGQWVCGSVGGTYAESAAVDRVTTLTNRIQDNSSQVSD